ncbi:hypothetical protein RD792_018157 [Penstemon davidsonii]|uniref:SAP domain-containing protein n=1 Tax=Penstemon davidsonii TaxID=160366 RepID=A0ABR0DX08_9LAMI|nr:hypothetical protein RD792_018157 [Penstemon davidsonii]
MITGTPEDQLAYFRIKELKDVLTQLGLSKQGKKQSYWLEEMDLVDRILAILSDERVSGMWAKKNAVGKEEVAKLVDDTYRKMQVSGAAESASKSQGVSDSTAVKLKEETEDSYQVEKIRCLCGSSLPTDSMIKCEDSRCNVWQHIKCVIIPEKPVEGAPPNPPDIFYCEICRLSRADPFWVTVAHPLYPVKMNITNVPTDGSNPGQSIEKTFQLTRADKDLLSKQEYDVQAWCMLLNDKVTFRMQWPQYADLQVNGVPVRAINRPGSQLLGANGRDDGPVITPCTRDGINKISLTGCDVRIFCVGVRIVKRRTLHQVLNMIPKEAEGEPFEDALSRVRRCVGGGAATENADSDSDIEVVADSIPVNLRCPWQCPICLKNYSLEKIIIDPYFNQITSKLRNCGEDVAEIEVKPDGSWRAKSEGDHRGLGELALWHLPDGTICASTVAESKPKLELKPVKQEICSDSHAGLKLGIKKNRNGCWVFNKPDDVQGISAANRLEENFGNNGQSIIPMSSSATGSGRDCEDASINQDGGGNIDFSTVNGIEYESISLNIDTAHGFNDHITSAPAGTTEVIVLSDSDDEIEALMSPGAAYKDAGPDVGVSFPAAPQPGILDSYYENPALGNGGSSSLGLYGTNDDDFGINMWSLPSGSQGGPGFQLFGSDADISDAMVDMQQQQQHGSSVNGYKLTTAETAAMESASLVPDESTSQLSNINDGLVDNPLALGNDPSLQIFLPTRPSVASAAQSDLRDQPDVSNGIRTEDWISLRLGDGGGVGQVEPTVNGLSSGQQLQPQPKDGPLSSLADTGLVRQVGKDQIVHFHFPDNGVLFLGSGGAKPWPGRNAYMEEWDRDRILGFGI